MHRNVTAVYPDYATAARVRRELAGFGITPGHIHVIPAEFAPVGPLGTREDVSLIEELIALQLPEDDFCGYREALRWGDYVVSAETERDAVRPVLEIMRRPEGKPERTARRGTVPDWGADVVPMTFAAPPGQERRRG